MKMDYLKELLVELEQEESMDVDGGAPTIPIPIPPRPPFPPNSTTNLSPGC